MKINVTTFILIILFFGVFFRLIISSNGNFFFNIDNARDMVDVREMVVLKKVRLIGPTTAIEGVFNGPAWYYLLAIPFIITGGDPYGSIVMEIILWAIGGYFLLMMVYQVYGKLAMVSVSSLWVSSNVILLGTQYAFNPNPILFLTPVFIYSLWKFIETEELKFSLLSGLLSGLFLQFEAVVGIFMLPVFILSIFLSKKREYFKRNSFWLGIITFFITLLPILFFELRHDFFMTKSLLRYQSDTHGGVNINLFQRGYFSLKSFMQVLLPTFMNFKLLTYSFVVAFLILLVKFFKEKQFTENRVTLISILLILVPILGLIPLKVNIMNWHLNASLVAAIALVGFIVSALYKYSLIGKMIALVFTISLLVFSSFNIASYLKEASNGYNNNSVLRHEIAAIDFVYQSANGKNFKAYTYIPSIIDYPYQYLFWWHGLKKYGFIPRDYAYAPGMPEYISRKEKLNTGSNPQDSNLVFLIKEPDPGDRHLWENYFKNLEFISKKMVGPLEIEIRRELP